MIEDLEDKLLKLVGVLIKGTSPVEETVVEIEQGDRPFRDALEDCLIMACKNLDIQVPLWLKKNTYEFARFRRTFFPKEQFMEKVVFDRFEIRLEGY